MSKIASASLFATVAVAMAACATKPPSAVETIPIANVVNALKAEMNTVETRAASRTADVLPASAACADPDGVVRVVPIPVSATIKIKVVTTTDRDISGGAQIPVGAIVIDPSVDIDYKDVKTQEIDIDLNIDHEPKTRTDLVAQIDTSQKNIAQWQREINDLTPDVQNSDLGVERALAWARNKITSATADLKKAEHDLLLAQYQATSGQPAAESNSGSVETSSYLGRPNIAKLDANLGIADAIVAASEQLLAVDHNAKPCLGPGQIKVEVDFQTINKGSAGVAFQVLVLKIGPTISYTDDLTHSIIVTFDLKEGSSLLIK